jgi:hypothetical protein
MHKSHRSIATIAVLAAFEIAGPANAQQHPAALGDLMTAFVQPRHIKLGLAGSAVAADPCETGGKLPLPNCGRCASGTRRDHSCDRRVASRRVFQKDAKAVRRRPTITL